MAVHLPSARGTGYAYEYTSRLNQEGIDVRWPRRLYLRGYYSTAYGDNIAARQGKRRARGCRMDERTELLITDGNDDQRLAINALSNEQSHHFTWSWGGRDLGRPRTADCSCEMRMRDARCL